MANWAQLRNGRMGVILNNDGRKVLVLPFDARKTREEWSLSDVVKILDPQDQADRRELGKRSKARAAHRRSKRSEIKYDKSHDQGESCPQCGTQAPSYTSNVNCPNCGYLEETSGNFRKYMQMFEYKGFRSHI